LKRRLRKLGARQRKTADGGRKAAWLWWVQEPTGAPGWRRGKGEPDLFDVCANEHKSLIGRSLHA
jgi:hypothetical protein